MENNISEIVKWLKDYADSASAKGFVFGLSGGIDSAVVAALSKLAFPDNSLGIIMPCESLQKDGDDAKEIAKSLNLDTVTVDLTNAYRSIINASFESDNKNAKTNIKPRLRMATLYYYAQDKNYLVLGSSNASEYYIGYTTKFGDSGADLFPIINFLKTEIFEMAKALDLPKFVIDKKPSAGLWEGQSDEGDFGFSYKDLDAHIRGEKIDPKIQEKIERMHKNSAHKRKLGPQFNR